MHSAIGMCFLATFWQCECPLRHVMHHATFPAATLPTRSTFCNLRGKPTWSLKSILDFWRLALSGFPTRWESLSEGQTLNTVCINPRRREDSVALCLHVMGPPLPSAACFYGPRLGHRQSGVWPLLLRAQPHFSQKSLTVVLSSACAASSSIGLCGSSSGTCTHLLRTLANASVFHKDTSPFIL
jgi:hypothetical protein